MSFYYFDSSAIAKRYLVEIGTSWIRTLTDPAAGNTIVLSEITRVEVAAALAARHRAGTITLAERDEAYQLVVLHTTTEYYMVPVDTPVLDRAMSLTRYYKLRGYDAVQLATALIVNARYIAASLPTLTFIVADDDLVNAARAEGLSADNPNWHP